MMAPLLQVQDIAKTFHDGPRTIHALQPVSFTLAEGEFVILLGPSGCGKSTLLRIVAGLLPADGGSVRLAGEAVRAPSPDVGMVFQKTNLMPWRTVLENVLLPVEIRQGKATPADRRQAESLLQTFGLQGFDGAYPRQLSGGMNQRVVLARTLIHEPRLLLMDEPFGQLDALTRERLNLEMLRLHDARQMTTLMVTHSIAEAVLLANRVLVMSSRPGRIVAEIAIDLPGERDLSVMGTEHFARLTAMVRRHISELSIQEDVGPGKF
jgi:NitT/TauT family transport system ATP-binding protein